MFLLKGNKRKEDIFAISETEEYIRRLLFLEQGSVKFVIHEGKVVQIERNELYQIKNITN